MSQSSRRIEAEPISAERFEPFGWLPVSDTDPADANHRLDFAWGDPHLNVICHGPEEVTHVDGGIVCDRMYRHASHTQALLVLDVDSVVAVAPADLDFSIPEHVGLVHAFRLSALDAFVLARGTWHWGPFPIGEEAVHLYNVQGLAYARDNDSIDLSPYGLVVSANGGS